MIRSRSPAQSPSPPLPLPPFPFLMHASFVPRLNPPNQQFYCVMNTWDESLASCSAPQENQYTTQMLLPAEKEFESPVSTASLRSENDSASKRRRAAKAYRYATHSASAVGGPGRSGGAPIDLECEEEEDLEEDEVEVYPSPHAWRHRTAAPYLPRGPLHSFRYRHQNELYYT